MSKVATEYTYDGKILSYEVVGNGYDIFLGAREIPWISQREPLIPNPELSYEEGCIKHIEEIAVQVEPSVELEPRVTELEKTVSTILGKEVTK